MEIAEQYIEKRILFESPLYVLSQGISSDGTDDVLLLRPGRHPLAVGAMDRELKILTQLRELPGALEYLGQRHLNGGRHLVFRHGDFMPLEGYFRMGTLSLPDPETVLNIAHGLAELLAALRERQIRHLALNPFNILIADNGREVRLAGWNFAEGPDLPPNTFEIPEIDAFLPYISPEQTGRTELKADARSDLYSLGVTVYQLLSNTMPFAGADRISILHSIIAKVPPSLDVLNPVVTTRFSEIVDRLLKKNPADRFSNADRLLVELEALVSGHAKGPQSVRHNQSDAFRIPTRLFGRENEAELLQGALSRAREGEKVAVTISGPAGVGKSALAASLRSAPTQPPRWYVRGRFDQAATTTPYHALIDAFSQLVHQLLLRNEDELAHWRHRLSEALGDNAAALAGFVPDIELIIGKQSPLPDNISADALNNRLKKAISQFIKAFSHPDKPLVLVLDDLHWAGEAFFELLESLLTDTSLQHCLFVFVYRDDATPETEAPRTFQDWLWRSQSSAAVPIGPLTPEAIGALLAEVLNRAPEAVTGLARIIHQKTGGNIFFVREFLERLHEDQLLQFDYRGGQWNWDEGVIVQREISDDVVELMLDKIQKLPDGDQEILKTAACFGVRFPADNLPYLSKLPGTRIEEALQRALTQGILIPGEAAGQQAFRFVHGRVREALYTSIPEQDRATMHFSIAEYMLAHSSPTQARDQAFDIIYHYSHFPEKLEFEDDRFLFAELSLVAARKARAAAADQQAYEYLGALRPILGTPKETRWYRLWMDVQLSFYESTAMTGHAEEAAEIFSEALAAANTRIDQLRLHLARARVSVSLTQLHDCLDACVTGLRLLDIKVPRKGSVVGVLREFLRTQWMLRGKSLDDLYNLPVVEGPEVAIQSELLYLSLHPAYVLSPELFAIFSLKTLQASIRKGVSPTSFLGFATYGIFLAVGFDAFSRAYKMVDVGVRIAEKHGHQSILLNATKAFMQPYRNPLRAAFPHAQKEHQIADAAGKLREASEPLTIDCINRYMAGLPLENVEQTARQYLAYISRSRTAHLYNSVLVTYLGLRQLRGARNVPLEDMEGRTVDATALQALLYDTPYLTIRAYHNLMRIHRAILLGDLDEAWQIALATKKIEHSVAGSYAGMELIYFRGLIPALQSLRHSGLKAMRLRRKAARIARRLGKWARSAPSNFAHKAALLRGLIAQSRGQLDQARARFEFALSDARTHEYYQNVAFAGELLANVLQAQGQDAAARKMLQQAFQGYMRWGAEAKTAQLLERKGEWLDTPTPSATPAEKTSVDLISILKASRSISGEISLAGLLHALMQTVIENAGAERGLLLMENQGELLVQAACDAQTEVIEVLQAVPATDGKLCPSSLINFVRRTQKAVVINDALQDPNYASDPYLRKHKPQSVLCMPVMNQSKLSGILYLENNLTTGAFTNDRLQVLDILTAQAAISIDNALLYDELEARVQQRTRELQETLDDLRATQDQLVQSEKLASLGQVTAGIAHEIRNPLNFVNNFSELSVELARELREEVEQQQGAGMDTDLVAMFNEYLDDLEQNAEKIQHHGRRAESIVTHMLRHAATDEQERQAILFNNLVREYAQLAYHGFRGRSEGFQSEIRYSLDPAIEEIVLNQQDISRALLNIFQNAFQAMEEKKAADPGYEPCLEISSTAEPGQVRLRIRDNGPGIPQAILDKIFEPFFTTKTTGRGTGLGLSMAYDMVVQRHEGTLDVSSQPGHSTTITITLPVTTGTPQL